MHARQVKLPLGKVRRLNGIQYVKRNVWHIIILNNHLLDINTMECIPLKCLKLQEKFDNVFVFAM